MTQTTTATIPGCILSAEGDDLYIEALTKKREGAIIMHRAIKRQMQALEIMIQSTERELAQTGNAVKRPFVS
jgi:hypothetical protein